MPAQNLIQNPISIQDFKNNVEFQMANLTGWLSIEDYQSALMKASCLVKALQELVDAEEAEQISNLDVMRENALLPEMIYISSTED